MKTNNRIGNTLLATMVACGLLACTSQDSAPQDSAPPPVATGSGTLCPVPTQALITDFTYNASAPGASPTEVRFGSGTGTLTGGEAYYPNSGANAITVDVKGSSYHVTGTVGDYTGFALYFDGCDHLNLSAFKGIQFTVSAVTPPPGNVMTFGVGTIDDKASAAWMIQNGSTTSKETDSGRCTPTAQTGNQYYHPGCTDPTIQIPITATATPQPVPWANLTGGVPVATVNPSEITTIYWYFPWSGSGAAQYPIDFTLDDLTLIQ
jgi:hypothetical protein